MKNYVGTGELLELTAPGGGVVAGTPVLIGGLLVIPTVTVAAGEKFAAGVTGVWNLPKVSGQTWSEGQRVYWNAGLGQVTTTALDGVFLGNAAAVALSAATTGWVRLMGGSEFLEGAQAANADTSGATLANLEIEVNELKAALRAVGIIAP